MKLTDFEIPRAPFKAPTTTDRDKAMNYYSDYWKFINDNGWDRMAYLYMFDEPNTEQDYAMVRDVGELVHTVAPEMKRLVVEQPYTSNPQWPDINPRQCRLCF
jgi:hypothetical protein